MLLQLHVINAADKRRLMDIYAESNLENTDFFYPELTDKQEAVRRVERDFLNYIETAFLSSGENTLLIWEEQGIWVSALRLYRMREGFFYIEALETRPDFRRSGYAAKLLRETTEMLKKTGPFRLCDNVDKQNEASLATHRVCGFSVVSENGYDYLQEETDDGSYGMEFFFA